MSNTRYGIFLRPDPATCLAVTRVTQAVRQQFGFVAAEVFAPHATFLGNVRTDGTDDELVSVLDPVFEKVAPFPVYNRGIETLPGSVRYNLNYDATGERPNPDLARVNTAIRDAVVPLHIRHDDYLAPNAQDYVFNAHLSLASFELAIEPRLLREVGEFIIGLPITAPWSFVLGWYTLFRFPNADWSGQWWNDMPWVHVKSWDVRSNITTESTP
jgi:hypothetical protein